MSRDSEPRVFEHDAMNTTFRVFLGECDEYSAQSAARDFFERLDQLEDTLSRYVPTSDVSRINALQAGESLFISEACHQCLLRAAEMHQLTGGLFDITLGAEIQHVKDGADGPPPEARGRLVIDPQTAAVSCESPGRQIDLGGIGKGFALDWLAPVLEEWQIPSALLAAGNSTFLVAGPAERAWPIRLTGADAGGEEFPLRQGALSVSGTTIQGAHIVDPRERPDQKPARIWIAADTAARADALSTAALLMTPEELDLLTAELDWARCVGRMFENEQS
jgi:thiamine biosynthesis lipoprotein